jgi:hypothetical protein
LHGKTIDKQLDRIDCAALARRSGFQKRTPRKIKPIEFLKSLCAGVFHPRVSLNVWASLLGLISGCEVSKQAFGKRVNERAVTYIRDVLFAGIGSLSGMHLARGAGVFARFRRVLIQDSTHIPLPDHLADQYPGASNQRRRKQAGMKVQAIWDLMTEQFVHFSLSPFTRTDQSASRDIISIAQEGDLIIRDLGYFVLSVFKQLNGLGVYFLSRLRSQVVIYNPRDGKRIDLLAELKKRGVFDMNVLLGEKERVPLRLVALPVSEGVANERRRKAKSNRDRRCRPSQASLELLGWQIFITNVDSSIWTTKTVADVYRIRWRIEIIFKAWKSHFDLISTPDGSRAQVEVCILAKLLFITFFHAFFDRINVAMARNNKPPISILKVAKLIKIFPILHWAALSEGHMDLITRILATNCSYEKRKRRQNFNQQLELLG